jgi:hypothetical protein
VWNCSDSDNILPNILRVPVPQSDPLLPSNILSDEINSFRNHVSHLFSTFPLSECITALSADVDSKSKWSASKARGEAAVREEFPDAVRVKFSMAWYFFIMNIICRAPAPSIMLCNDGRNGNDDYVESSHWKGDLRREKSRAERVAISAGD